MIITNHKLKLSSLTIVAIACFFLFGLTSVASAQALIWGADSNVTVGSDSYTISSGSEATSLVIGLTTAVIVIPDGSTFTFVSNDAYSMDASDTASTATTTCTGSVNTVVSSGATTLTIVPDSNSTCSLPGSGGQDSSPPSDVSVVIDNNNSSTSSGNVTLSLTAVEPYSNAIYMIISEDSSFEDSVWEDFSSSKSWTLSSGDGTKTIYVKFKDNKSNTSAVISDSIVIDSTTETTDTSETTTEITDITTTTDTTVTNTSTTTDTTVTNTSTTTVLISTFMKSGSKAGEVMNLQKLLNDYANANLFVDGDFGPATDVAVKNFQTSQGLDADGMIGANTRAALNAVQVGATVSTGATTSSSDYVFTSPNISIGSQGVAVEMLQKLLNANGFDCGGSDGSFGTNTTSCVKAFQSSNGLGNDGVIGSNSRAKLNSL
jgi:peptidoglycan hydrolase-like protein with peptidoglycan-binding domain